MYELLLALSLTVLVEFPVIYLFIREKPGRTLLYIIIINLFTLPLATFSYIYLLSNLVVIEALVILAEFLLIKLLFLVSLRNAFLISFTANILSAALGIVIFTW